VIREFQGKIVSLQSTVHSDTDVETVEISANLVKNGEVLLSRLNIKETATKIATHAVCSLTDSDLFVVTPEVFVEGGSSLKASDVVAECGKCMTRTRLLRNVMKK
jgi:hypothetical protein